jgi:cell division protein FtsL
MAKIVKRKRRRIRLRGFAILLLTFSMLFWLATTLFVNTANASLTIKIQSMNSELATLTSENQTLNFEIQSLENKDRVYDLAEVADMGQNQDNIISVNGGE